MIINDELFSKDECNQIIGLLKYDNLIEKIVRLDIDGEYKYKTHGIFYNEKTGWVLNRMIDWFFNKTSLTRDEDYTLDGYMINHYKTGDYFKKHIDKCKRFPNRDINLGVILTDDFSGGDYICYDINDKPIHFPKKAGTVIGYTSEVPHEITEVLSGDRWSVVFISNGLIKKNNKLI